jgi:hypothetical protein
MERTAEEKAAAQVVGLWFASIAEDSQSALGRHDLSALRVAIAEELEATAERKGATGEKTREKGESQSGGPRLVKDWTVLAWSRDMTACSEVNPTGLTEIIAARAMVHRSTPLSVYLEYVLWVLGPLGWQRVDWGFGHACTESRPELPEAPPFLEGEFNG